jgi:hypothetical protein
MNLQAAALEMIVLAVLCTIAAVAGNSAERKRRDALDEYRDIETELAIRRAFERGWAEGIEIGQRKTKGE